jgi:hypothetical protein
VQDMIQAWEELTEDVVQEGRDFEEEWEAKRPFTQRFPVVKPFPRSPTRPSAIAAVHFDDRAPCHLD